jgi:hypothetical protein
VIKNPGTKILKIQEQKLQKSEYKNYKNPGTKKRGTEGTTRNNKNYSP